MLAHHNDVTPRLGQQPARWHRSVIDRGPTRKRHVMRKKLIDLLSEGHERELAKVHNAAWYPYATGRAVRWRARKGIDGARRKEGCGHL